PSRDLSKAVIDSFNNDLVRSGGRTIALLQFARVPSEADRKTLLSAGIELLSYVPDSAYTISISAPATLALLQSVKVKGLMPLLPQQKMEETLARGAFPAYAVKVSGTLDVRLLFSKATPATEVLAFLQTNNYEILSTAWQHQHLLDIRIPVSRLKELAASPYVEFVQALPPPDMPLNLSSRTGGRANVLNRPVASGGKGLNGEGIVIGVGDNANIQRYVDFSGRLLSSGNNDFSAHGVHVSGTAGGAGIVNELYRGYAPKAKIVSEFFSGILARVPVFVQDYNMLVTNNSYGIFAGCSVFGIYEGTAAAIDGLAFDYPKLLNVFAAGNSGSTTCAPFATGFHTVLGGYQSAKNALMVGNTTDSALVITASSKGPVKDGRLKPEITAMGTNVTSAWPTNTYAFNTGTSMSAPAVTGGAALLYQRYRQLNSGADAPGALIKALLCNGASDRGNKGPDFTYGFGWMNLIRSVSMLDSTRYLGGSITNSAVVTRTIAIPANTASLKVMLYWHDPAASPAASRALVNDLDLEVITPTTALHLPQILDTSAAGLNIPSTMGADHLNNIEQVIIDNPAAGNYTFTVRGTAVTMNPSQEYYLVYDIVPVQLTLTAPFGGESLAPTLLSSTKSKITWEAEGYSSGTVTIEYTDNGGASWINLASGIDINRRIYSWLVPGIATNQARVRITKEGSGESSVSMPFTIIAVPIVSLATTQCPGYMAVSWPSIPGVSDYEVLRLFGEEMVSIATTTDSFFTLKSLSPDSTYWVGVRARVGGQAGVRSVAVSRQANTGTCSGTISDNDLLLAAISSPRSGRKFTSTSLTATTPVTLQIKNNDDMPVTGFTLRYNVNGGPWVTEVLAGTTIAAGATYIHTFVSTSNMSALVLYTVAAEVLNATADPVAGNNSITTTVRHLDNQPLTLGFFDNLETAVAAAYTFDTVGLAGIDRYDFENSLPTARIRTFVNTGLAYSGNRALTSESTIPLGTPTASNTITGTYNLSGYSAASNDIRLDFRYLFTGHTANAVNRVWIRGADTDAWKEVYQCTATKNEYQLTQSIEIADSLVKVGQNFSPSFQVRWEHPVFSSTIERLINFSVDDIRLYEVVNDVQLIRIDTPVATNCGLNSMVPLKVTVHNSHNGVRTNIPVKYSINNGPWIRELITSIPANTTLQYTFASTL
ncbi:MAG: S8 family serine peptidase, partial [Chitinophagaceae bacterium]